MFYILNYIMDSFVNAFSQQEKKIRGPPVHREAGGGNSFQQAHIRQVKEVSSEDFLKEDKEVHKRMVSVREMGRDKDQDSF